VSKRMLSLGVAILVLFFGANNFLYAQKFDPATKDADLAARLLENVQIESQSIGSLFSHLSLYYDIPIGLETALSDDEFATYQIDFKKGTLSDLLTRFVARYDKYDWEIKDGVVNVFPKGNQRNVLFKELLDTTISSFSVKENTSCVALIKSLLTTPEIKRILEINETTYRTPIPGGFGIQQVGRDFKLDVSNMTLKSILNKVIKESPTANFWLITRDSYDQALFVNLSARHEELPMKDGKPVLPQQNAH
jgi:hypothetical protein